MDKNPKKSIDSLKAQEVDATDVKGGYTLVRNEDSIGYYEVNAIERWVNAATDAKSKGFKAASIFHKGSGSTKIVDIMHD